MSTINIKMRTKDAAKFHTTLKEVLEEFGRFMPPKDQQRLKILIRCLEEKIWNVVLVKD